jgi:hypothetical protein
MDTLFAAADLACPSRRSREIFFTDLADSAVCLFVGRRKQKEGPP